MSKCSNCEGTGLVSPLSGEGKKSPCWVCGGSGEGAKTVTPPEGDKKKDAG